MKYTLSGYIAYLATDGTYVVASRNDMTIGYLQPTSAGWAGVDVVTTANGRHIATAVCDSVTGAFDELLLKGGWRVYS